MDWRCFQFVWTGSELVLNRFWTGSSQSSAGILQQQKKSRSGEKPRHLQGDVSLTPERIAALRLGHLVTVGNSSSEAEAAGSLSPGSLWGRGSTQEVNLDLRTRDDLWPSLCSQQNQHQEEGGPDWDGTGSGGSVSIFTFQFQSVKNIFLSESA